MCFKKFVDSSKDYLYLIFRVLVGSMFALHGLAKLGFLSNLLATGFAPLGQAWLGMLVAYIELLGGLAILLGFFSRLGAAAGGIVMLCAYFIVHASVINPTGKGGGELPLLYLAAFLIVLIHGNGKFSLERVFWKKEHLW